MLYLNKVYKRYKKYGVDKTSRTDDWVLRNLSLHLEDNRWVAIVGKSGSGKSTLLNIIAGIDLVNSGQVVLLKNELSAMNEKSRTMLRRRHIGFVMQNFDLFPTLNVMENIMLPQILNRCVDLEWNRYLLTTIEMIEKQAEFPDALSGGEQQRVAIARALSHRPRFIIADEPTGNLDEKSSENILDLFSHIKREYDCTLIMATHSRQVVEYVDKVYEMHEGALSPNSDAV